MRKFAYVVKRMNMEKKKSKLLERVSKIISSGLFHQSGLRNEMIVLLKIMDNLSEEKLDQQLNQTLKIISKRLSLK